MKRPYVIRLYKDRKGEHRWRMRAGNGQIVADSAEGYTTAKKAEEAALRLLNADIVLRVQPL